MAAGRATRRGCRCAPTRTTALRRARSVQTRRSGHRARRDAEPLADLARSFDGAWPYLEYLAQVAGVGDPLDPAVTTAYWVGSDLLDGVDAAEFAERVRSDQRDLEPRDMIDLQSFIWVQGSDEY